MGKAAELLNEEHGALLSALLGQSEECIELLDESGRVLFANREGCRSLELGTSSDLLGQPWIEQWPEASRSDIEDALLAAVKGSAGRFSAPRQGSSSGTRWWDVTLTPIAGGGVARVVTIARDVTAELMEKERINAINAEMRHRLGNAMTIAAGIVTLEARAAPEHQPFARAVLERFAQLTHVQELVLSPANEKSLKRILPLLAGVYGNGRLLEIGVLPDVKLTDAATQALALTLGELTTNSLKYGALRAGKTVKVDGTVEDGVLHITWREPTAFGAQREGGQGLGLMDRLLTAAGGRIRRDLEPGTLIASVYLPIVP